MSEDEVGQSTEDAPTMVSDFVHLHVHSEYSLVDGITRIKPLIQRVSELNMPAVAITDHCNLYAVIKFYRTALSQGVKPIIGAEVWVENPVEVRQLDKIILLAGDNAAYRALCELLSNAIIKNQHLGKPVVSWSFLSERASGMIAISHARAGYLAKQILEGEQREASVILARYQALFASRFYLELSQLGSPNERQFITQALSLSSITGIPLLATNEVQFIDQADFHSHELRVCINEGRLLGDPRRARHFTDQQYLKSGPEMEAMFSDYPDAIQNTLEIAKRCNVFFEFGIDYLPQFPGSGEQTAEQALLTSSEQGLAKRLEVPSLCDEGGALLVEQRYIDRLNFEISVINQMGFPGYFLIVADFIQWSREHEIPVGPGRGSGAGSVVAWAMGITELDPLEFGLLFERFLNPERVSMPDFDIDFCMEGRDRVIAYVAECYGRDQVSQIITFGSMAAKAVLRDVGRVLGHSYGFVDSIAKLVPFKPGIKLDEAIEMEEELRLRYKEDSEAAELIDEARKLEGIARNVGKHAGGVVIAPSKLTDFTALYAESETAQAVTQLDKDDLEAIGLVKFDFLGLRTLTIIDWAIRLVNDKKRRQGEPEILVPAKAFKDELTFSLIKKAQTVAVFQLESSGMRDLVARLQPDCFEDLIALVALYRPGPLDSGMVDDYVDRKHGRQQVQYPHPLTEAILGETYGVILYQEQVMQIAQVLAKVSLGGADLLRRAMGKKKIEEMAKQREIFESGAVANGIAASEATYIFDLMEKFAGYGFNKSHSAAYALVSFQTAWLKAHYTAEFMSATMSADMDHTDRIVGLIAESRVQGLVIASPNINQGLYKFHPIDDTNILYGLGAIKGVGEAAIESIVGERDRRGNFVDLQDFCCRIDASMVSKRTFESLIRAGALDVFAVHRAQLLADLPYAVEVAGQNNKAANAGQADLFGIDTSSQSLARRPAVISWSELRQLQEERVALGLYLSGHPYDSFRDELQGMGCSEVIDRATGDGTVVVAGMCVGIRVRPTRTGGKMAYVTLDDGQARLDVVVFSNLYDLAKQIIVTDRILIAQGVVDDGDKGFGPSMRTEGLSDIDFFRQDALGTLRLSLGHEALNASVVEKLKASLKPFLGGAVYLDVAYQRQDGVIGIVRLGEAWCVVPQQELIDQLQRLFGLKRLSWIYRGSEQGSGLRYQAERPAFSKWKKS